jgi:hypothetical protein
MGVTWYRNASGENKYVMWKRRTYLKFTVRCVRTVTASAATIQKLGHHSEGHSCKKLPPALLTSRSARFTVSLGNRRSSKPSSTSRSFFTPSRLARITGSWNLPGGSPLREWAGNPMDARHGPLDRALGPRNAVAALPRDSWGSQKRATSPSGLHSSQFTQSDSFPSPLNRRIERCALRQASNPKGFGIPGPAHSGWCAVRRLPTLPFSQSRTLLKSARSSERWCAPDMGPKGSHGFEGRIRSL